MLILSWLLAVCVGLPLRYRIQNETVLSTSLLFAVWFTTLAIQSSFKTNLLCFYPRLSTTLFGLSNAVLWTSLAMIAYVFAETAMTQRPLHATLDTLQTNVTVTDLIFPGHLPTIPTAKHMAAGDIALCILNAGLVSWGLKLYECRKQLLSRAGLTVFIISSLIALSNVTLGPLLAHAVGLRPASAALAFAARSVTLALGNPVMVMLQGDIGLNAAIVVMSGIVFQIGLGFGIGSWLERYFVSRGLYWLLCRWRQPAANSSVEDFDGVLTTTARSSITLQGSDGNLDVEAQRVGRHDDAAVAAAESSRIVAAGVTIGINAAAMGTAYLNDVKSKAAPYSTLSMMAMGIMTVVFASISPLQRWVIEAVSTTS